MIICARYILPLDNDVINDGAILIKGEYIDAIGTRQNIINSYPGEFIKDLGDAIVFPGFINAHTHLEYSALNVSNAPIYFTDWLQKIIQKSRTLSFVDWEKSTALGVKKLMGTGITTIADISRSGTSFQVLSDSPYTAFIFQELVALDDKKLEQSWSDLTEKISNKILKTPGEKFFLGLSPHSLYTLSLNALKQIASFARKHSLPLMIHISETKEEMEFVLKGTGYLKELMSSSGLDIKYGYDATPIQILANNNILDPHTILVHGVHITDHDIKLLKRHKSGLVLCPRSNAFLKVGNPPIQTLYREGIVMGIGTDSLSSNTDFNMFEEMRSIKNIFPEIDNKKLLIMATVNGAKILNIFSSRGSITPGKYADINAVKIKQTALDKLDPYEYICGQAGNENICLTIADGDIIYMNES